MNAKKGERKHRREPGAGTIYRKGRIWMARWVVDGKVFKRSTGKTGHNEALARLNEFTAPFRAWGEVHRLESIAARLEGAKADARRIEDSTRPRFLVADLPDAYAASARRGDCSGSTLERYQSQLRQLAAFLSSAFPQVRELRDVRSVHAEAFLRTLRSASPNTYNKRLVLFRSVWKILGPDAGCAENPWAGMSKRKLETVSKRPLSSDEIDRVLAAASGEIKTLILVGLYTGLRLGDALRLDWADVDLNDGFIRLRPRKTARSSGRVVDIPLVPALRVALAAMSPAASGPVMPGLADRYGYNPSGVAVSLRRVFESAGIQTRGDGNARAQSIVGFHSLRHTFVTTCALHGVPLTVVQAIVGHSTPKMTEYYAHSDRETARREISRAFAPAERATDAPRTPDGENTVPQAENSTARDLGALLAGIADGSFAFSSETPEPGANYPTADSFCSS